MEQYLNNGVFPSKNEWKKVVIEAIKGKQNNLLKEKMTLQPALARLAKTHRDLRPVVHWEVLKRNPIHRIAIANLVNIICGNIPATLLSAVTENDDYHYNCNICNKQLMDINYHFIMDCSATII